MTASLESTVASQVAERRKLDAGIVARALQLMNEGRCAPYLARYRREEVGGLDEYTLRDLFAEARHVREMEQRREFILRGVAERGNVPPKIRRRIERCRHRTELEYLYEPYRPPRKTPGSLAREHGLQPLAAAFLGNEEADPAPFVDPDRGVATLEEALRGAREILAERFAVDPDVRRTLLRVVEKEGAISAAPAPGKTEIPDRLAHLRKYEERLARVPSHRFLSLRRAEKEGAISIRVTFNDEKVLAMTARRFYPKEPSEAVKAFLDQAAADAVRIMRPAVLQDALNAAKIRADDEAIAVFRRNLADLLLYPPAGPHRVMGVDPALRGAIPVACVDERGAHLEHCKLKIFDRDEAKVAAARERVLKLVRTHGIELIAIGNGPGRRECEAFFVECLEELGEDAPIAVIVTEVGVGSYASGPVGRAEQPALAVPIRAAVSLARRLVDPLPELVKVDPKQIGVGQYQNDVDATRLGRALDEVVQECVNLVAVDVNRAPVQQLSHICGFTTSTARALVRSREQQGPLRSLAALALEELPFITPQTFEQAAGFLRIRDGDNPLDATGVHPRHGALVEKIASKLGVEQVELVGNTDLLAKLAAEDFADEDHTPATVAAVLSELLRGGEDERPTLELVRRTAEVRSASELKPGMPLSGRVTNVTNFGAFIDIGVQQDGLV
ncbi:MAG: Tex-like N-terminal domain-containing protein, partial [Planctomycetota bacterium]